MPRSRILHKQQSRWASDLEFVKLNNRAYIRSAVFLRMPESGKKFSTSHSLETVVVTLKPEVVLQLGHTLPTGHAIRMNKQSILSNVSQRVSLRNTHPIAREITDLSIAEKDLYLRGFRALNALCSEIETKKVYSIPNVQSIDFEHPLQHGAFEQLLERISWSGTYSMYEAISDLSHCSAELASIESHLKRSFFLRLAMEFMWECLATSQRELFRIHHTLLDSKSYDWESKKLTEKNCVDTGFCKSEMSSIKSRKMFVASSIQEVGRYLADFLIREGESGKDIKLHFYGSSDLQALIETLECYHTGITTSNPIIRSALFNCIDFTNHRSFNRIYNAWGYRIPKLHEALSLLPSLSTGYAFQSFLSTTRFSHLSKGGDHHNPIWDADALLCIISACEWLDTFSS